MKKALILAGVLGAAAIQAETWTNAAGHGMTAQILYVKNDMVVLKNKAGQSFKMRLNSFSEQDQKRISKRFYDRDKATSSRKTTGMDAQLDRLNQLYAAGYIDQEEYQRLHSDLLQHITLLDSRRESKVKSALLGPTMPDRVPTNTTRAEWTPIPTE